MIFTITLVTRLLFVRAVTMTEFILSWVMIALVPVVVTITLTQAVAMMSLLASKVMIT